MATKKPNKALLKAALAHEYNAAKVNVTILDNAKALVYGSRAEAYGHPSDNFNNIARLQNAYLEIIAERPIIREKNSQMTDWDDSTLSPIDIAIMNILQKCARLATNQTHMDSVIDIAGYAATIERIVDNK